MNDVIMWIIIGLVGAGLLAFIIYYLIKFCKLSKEERIKVLKTYLKGAIALAEQEIVGNKKGEEKLAMVEEYFRQHAPWFLKALLLITGKDNLKDLIEEALKEVKGSFEKITVQPVEPKKKTDKKKVVAEEEK